MQLQGKGRPGTWRGWVRLRKGSPQSLCREINTANTLVSDFSRAAREEISVVSNPPVCNILLGLIEGLPTTHLGQALTVFRRAYFDWTLPTPLLPTVATPPPAQPPPRKLAPSKVKCFVNSSHL